MSLLADPFDLEESGPKREKRTDRPLLIPAKGGERVPYTRMSTLADFVTNDHGLNIWQRRLLALGLSQREDVCGMLACLPPLNDAMRDKSTLSKAEQEQDKDTKKKIDNYIEMALETAGQHYKANHGTGIHGFVENGCACRAPERMKPDVQSALDLFKTQGIEVLASEVFVANDILMAAGSFDHLVRVPDLGIVVLDVKTGQVQGKAMQFAIQVGGYSKGEVYDWRDDSRAPLESLTGGEKVNRAVGLVCHVPLGGARTQLYKLNLRRGQQAAVLATQVRTARSLSDFAEPFEVA